MGALDAVLHDGETLRPCLPVDLKDAFICSPLELHIGVEFLLIDLLCPQLGIEHIRPRKELVFALVSLLVDLPLQIAPPQPLDVALRLAPWSASTLFTALSAAFWVAGHRVVLTIRSRSGVPIRSVSSFITQSA